MDPSGELQLRHVMDLEAFPRLHTKVRRRIDRASGQTLLVYPERALRLNASAGAIVALCDGRRRVSDIVEALAERHPEVVRSHLERDVHGLLQRLVERGLLRCGAPTEPTTTRFVETKSTTP